MRYDPYLEAAGTVTDIINETNKKIEELKNKFKGGLDKTDQFVKNQMKEPDSEYNTFLKNINSVPWIRSKSSIVSKSKNTVMQFPVYISNNINIEIAQIISKVFERVYFSFVQSTLSIYPTINAGEEDGAAFLKKFHTNISEAVETIRNLHIDDIDTFDQMMKESVLNLYLIENGIILYSLINPNESIINESNRLNSYKNDGFNHYFKEAPEKENNINKFNGREVNLADYATDIVDKMDHFRYPPKDPGRQPIKRNNDDADSFKFAMDRWTQDDKAYSKFNTDKRNVVNDVMKELSSIINNYNGDPEEYAKALNIEADKAESAGDKTKADGLRSKAKRITSSYSKFEDGTKIKNGKIIFPSKQISQDKIQSNQKPSVRAPQMLRDADVRKINSMAPYTMLAQFRIKDEDGKYSPVPVEYIIGVKSILHPVDINDLADEMDDLVTGQENSLQKVRYKTGEVKLKDYLFQISKAKKDAYNAAQGKWTSNLKRLTNERQKIFEDDGLIPNATLVITNSDANIIKEKSGYDINSIGIATRVARNMFLIAIAIVDPTAGTMKTYFPDIDSGWDVQSLSSINNEVTKAQNTDMSRELQKIISSSR